MHSNRHAALPHDHAARTGVAPGPSVRTRTLRRVAVGVFSVAFAVGSPSVALAADHASHRGGQGSQWSGGGAAALSPTAALPAFSAVVASPTPTSTSYAAWAPHVQPVVAEVVAALGVPTVLTRPGHSPTQQLAADFMVYSNDILGDNVAKAVIYNAARFNVEYVIWKQLIWIVGGSGWRAMEDRGSPTANHMDHVHVSFRP